MGRDRCQITKRERTKIKNRNMELSYDRWDLSSGWARRVTENGASSQLTF